MRSRLLNVTGAASSYDLTTLAAVKSELNLSDTENDATLSRYITEASSEMAAWFNRVFIKETVQEIFRGGEYRECLVMGRAPIVSVASIVEDGTTISGADYEIDKKAGLIYRLSSDCRSCWSSAKIVVTYDGGYVVADTLPALLSSACIATVKGKFTAKARDPRLRVEEIRNVLHQEYWVGQIGDGSFPPGVNIEALATYRNIPV